MTTTVSNSVTLFLLQLALVLGVARVLAYVLRRVGQPSVVAEMLAGIVLGPSVLGWIAPQAAAAVFPPGSLPVLGFVSEIGLILFMFLVGLELNVQMLRGFARAAMVLVPGSTLLPFALAVPLAVFVHARAMPPSTPLVPFVIFVGVALSVTAVPVLARILVERRLLRTRLGTLSIASAAGGDVLGWCALSFAFTASRAERPIDALHHAALAVGFVLAMLFGARPLLGRLGAFAARRSHGVSQGTVAAVFLLLLGSSVAADRAGLSPLLGAFLFGTVMPKADGFSRHLAEKIEDVVLVLFLPLFFAYSGLRTEVRLLDDAAAWQLSGLVILVGCVGKFAGGTLAARAIGFDWRAAGAFGALMNTRGLMAVIVLNVGLDLGLLSPLLFTAMIVMALWTTVITTPILDALYPSKHAARDAVRQAAPPAAVEATRAFTVVAKVTNDARGGGLLTLARAVAKAPGARVFALQLLAPDERPSFLLDEQREASPAARAGEPRALSFVSARPARDLCEMATIKEADVVLLDEGDVAREVRLHAATTVGVLLDRGLDAVRRVVVMRNTGANDRAALTLARKLAEMADVPLAMHPSVEEDPQGDLVVTGYDDERPADARCSASMLLVRGPFAHRPLTSPALPDALHAGAS